MGQYQCMLSADDTCILFSDNSWDLVHRNASIELNRLLQKLNLSRVNLSKWVPLCYTLGAVWIIIIYYRRVKF